MTGNRGVGIILEINNVNLSLTTLLAIMAASS